MTLSWLFFHFHGRIPRKIFILASLLLFFLQSALSFVFLNMVGVSLEDFQSLEDYKREVLPHLIPLNLISSVVFLWPNLAIGVKRLQDIGWSGRVYGLLCVSLLLLYVIGVMGASGSGDAAPINLGLLSLINLLVLGTYVFLIIMIFWPGPKERNRYGDPLY